VEKFKNKMEITKTNIKTGKPYSRQSIWRQNHPEKIEIFRGYSKTPKALEMSSIRTIKNKLRLRKVKLKYYHEHKNNMKREQDSKKNHAHYIASREYTPSASCDICGNTKEKLEIHHWNYDKPLMVNTLCRTCHKIQHLKNFERWLKCKLEADKQLEVAV
jgi:hypothetical protein